MLSVFGFSIGIDCRASLLHHLPDSFLGAIGVLSLREYEVALNSPTIGRTTLLTLYSVSIIWFVVLFTKGVHSALRIGRGGAFIMGTFTSVAYQFVFVIFNR